MPILQRHFDALWGKHQSATLTRNPDGSAAVVVPGVKLPPGWNRSEVTVAFVAPAGYPQAPPDCFWTEPGLALAHGGLPKNTGQNHVPGITEGWLWFSWHPSLWNSNRDSLETYLKIICQRLKDAL